MGVNTIHLLPITSVGSDGNKGTLGSPYAIKNPYEIDPNLAEPNLGVGADNEFAAFVEAAHHLGMRVVVEFVFRTSAKDGDWVAEHPEWYYWIKAKIEDRLPGEHLSVHEVPLARHALEALERRRLEQETRAVIGELFQVCTQIDRTEAIGDRGRLFSLRANRSDAT